MDPNEALKEARLLVLAILDDDSNTEEANQLGELFEALDEWLSKGGFLPKEWKR